MDCPSKAELQLTLATPSDDRRAKGAVGPRESKLFRKLAVQRVGYQREITVHSVLGVAGMNLLGQLHADSQNRN